MRIFLYFLAFLDSAFWNREFFTRGQALHSHFPVLNFITRQQVEFQIYVLQNEKKILYQI